MNRDGFDDFDLFVTCEEFYNDSNNEWEVFFIDDEDTENEN